jgi:hypothetical protein
MDPQNLKQIDPLAVLLDVLDAPNVVPGPRMDQAVPNMANDAQPHSTDSQTQTAPDGAAASTVPPVDTTFRPAADNARIPGDRPSIARRVVRGLIGFLLALCIGVASFVWQSPYGDEARQRLASWVPQFALTLLQPREDPGLAAQPTSPADQAVAATTTAAQTTPGQMAPAQAAPPQPAPPTQTAAEAAAPTAAALSPESTQLLQSMARDIATVEQGIEQLKASQEQLARDNAKLAEQIKVNQERMTRVLLAARSSEQSLRPKPAARLPLPTGREMREPVSTLPPPQAIVPPLAATQPAIPQPGVDPELPSAPRPPMPVR